MERSKPREVKIYGQNACWAVFRNRQEDILRVFLSEAVLPSAKPILKYCASQRLPYRVVEAEELQKVSGSQHHEGLIVVARPAPTVRLRDLINRPGPLLILDGVKNPHNLGAILRSAAHFGAAGLVLDERAPKEGGAAWRTAEGGAEWVPIVRVSSLEEAVAESQAGGLEVIATAGTAKGDLFSLPAKRRFAFILGAERDGVSAPLKARADRVVKIPGTGQIESLNVASATAVILSERWRVGLAGGAGTP